MLFQSIAYLAIDEHLGNREFVGHDQLLNQPDLGLVLRLRLTITEQRALNGRAQFVECLEIAQILGEFVVQLGQFLLAKRSQRHFERDRLA